MGLIWVIPGYYGLFRIQDVYGTVLSLVRLAPFSHTDFAKILKVRNTPE